MKPFLIAIMLIAAIAPADAKSKQRGCRDVGQEYVVPARACDPVTHECAFAWRRFRNPVWR